MKKIIAVAKKEKHDKIVIMPIGHRHKEIPGKGKHEFVDSNGKVEKRKEAEKTAKKADQIKPGEEHKKLHSSQLKAFKGKK